MPLLRKPNIFTSLYKKKQQFPDVPHQDLLMVGVTLSLFNKYEA